MNTSTKRSISISQLIASVVGFLLFLSGPDYFAGTAKSNEKLRKTAQEKNKIATKETGRIKEKRLSGMTGIDLGSLGGIYAKFTKDQSWTFGNPRSDLQELGPISQGSGPVTSNGGGRTGRLHYAR
ncbi:MAG: hypothetical protein U5J63_13060 [Fodinibius sp.]|nr:hypothetical protein [Fodinibius sp.]